MASAMGSTRSAGAARTMGNGQVPAQGGKSILCNGSSFMKVKNKMTALVVDNVTICRMCEHGLLVAHGLATRSVDNGFDAVNLFASGANFDLLVIDMHLPVMNGLEVTRRIRATGLRTKIIGITAFGFERERLAFMEAGADAFFGKPLTTETLLPILIEMDKP